HGRSARLVSGTPPHAGPPRARPATLPAMAIGVSADLERVRPGDAAPDHDVWHYGGEAMLASTLSLRAGYIDDKQRRIRDYTIGIGAAYQLGAFAGARWDWARVPQGNGLPKVDRRGFSIWVDPLAMLASRHR